ncbi:MAG: 4-hydroxythreonine-4-phosphate dehydrogenase PdxA [Ignavibacteriae bacterium HGW-Ignavibacteriae-3]|nr:MAG: 4-hydroxythreonine-4-phosphate dehydrogenase PdxA [Ignavibacteriae bacterium HGW-Ignavibacteriae-3]
MKTLAFTCGDINGIGPEICIKSINKIYKPGRRKIILLCPADVFEQAASVSKPSFDYFILKENKPIPEKSQEVVIIDIGKSSQNRGVPSRQSGLIAFKAISLAFEMCRSKSADAMITAPVSKKAFHLANINYPGQTELLADLAGSKKFMMLFLSKMFICGLCTIHQPIKNVSRLISRKSVQSFIQILFDSLVKDLGIPNPRIAVLGLNPHSGEDGNIGREEIQSIIPAIKSFVNGAVDGPMVPDAFFANRLYNKYDAVLGMYHDQVLIPFKMMNFNTGVNFTAGIQVIRTSPDHGTAFDISGKGIADPSSMIEAVKWAEKILANRRKISNAR